MAGMAMMDELVQAVARDGQLSAEQAAVVVAAMLRFFAARLPSPLFGELQARLKVDPAAGTPATGDGGR